MKIKFSEVAFVHKTRDMKNLRHSLHTSIFTSTCNGTSVSSIHKINHKNYLLTKTEISNKIVGRVFYGNINTNPYYFFIVENGDDFKIHKCKADDDFAAVVLHHRQRVFDMLNADVDIEDIIGYIML